MTSLAGLVAGLVDRLMTKSSAASAVFRFGAKPPSSPTLVLWPAFFSSSFRVWKISGAAADRIGEGLGARPA